MRTRLAFAALLATAATAASASPARAACTSSTPVAAGWEDTPDDAELSLAPEIKGLSLALDAACRVNGAVAIGEEATSLIEGDSVTVYLDTDGDAGSGSPQWSGADRAVVQVGRSGDDAAPALLAWDGAQFAPAGELERAGPGAVTFSSAVDRLTEAPAGARLRVRAVSSFEGLRDTYEDYAPEPDAEPFALSLTWASSAPPPPQSPADAPPPVAPPPPVAAPVPTPTPPTPRPARRCPAASLRGLPLAAAQRRLRGAGCRFRIIRVRTRRHRAGRVYAARRDGDLVVLRVALRPRRRT